MSSSIRGDMTAEDKDEFLEAPYRAVALAEPSVDVERRGGGIILRPTQPLGDYHRQMGIPLRLWAERSPNRLFLAERNPDGEWRKVTYAEARGICDRLSQALMDRGLNRRKPLVILSDNSVNFALLGLAAMQVGIPVSPVSPAYSLMSSDYSKLKPIIELLEPGIIYAEDGRAFEKALAAIELKDAEVVAARNPPDGIAATPYDGLLTTGAGPAVDEAFEAVSPDDTAKFLFTSGSTGTPKAVINTHRMLCSNQQMTVQTLQFLADRPPVMVEWLPWNHTAAGNQIFNMVMFNGGSYYIDGGRPVPGKFEETLRNLREVSPTAYFNVPAGFASLLPHLEGDAAFRDHFFRDLEFAWYAGAALTQDLWDRFERVAYEATGNRIVMTSGYGTTESSPSLTFAHWPGSRLGHIGLPLPGAEIKLAPVGDKLEVRAKGPLMTPGYYKDPDLTAAGHDEEGYYKFGDAMRFVDPDRPGRGLIFDGRISENFKLATGTWVTVGQLRVDLIAAAAPLIQDMVICGHDGAFIAVLAWPALPGCRELAGLDGESGVSEIVKNADIRAALAEKLAAFNAAAGGSSRVVRRLMLVEEPARIDANEITDKGYINQRAVLERRADLVEELFADPPSGRVIEIGAGEARARA